MNGRGSMPAENKVMSEGSSRDDWLVLVLSVVLDCTSSTTTPSDVISFTAV